MGLRWEDKAVSPNKCGLVFYNCGSILRKFRGAQKMPALAKKAGIDVSTWSVIENNKRGWDYYEMHKIAPVLGVKVEDIVMACLEHGQFVNLTVDVPSEAKAR